MAGMRPIGTSAGGGSQGPQGFPGAQGTQGVQGSIGAQGGQGFQGDIGFQGYQGVQGLAGIDGADGADGADGPQGLTGSTGVQGAQGPQGSQGFQGVQGSQGVQGFQGNQGFQGVAGSQGGQGVPAPTTAEFVTTASTGDLSSEVSIPGLAGSADVEGSGGAGTSEEYDTSTTGLSWTPSTPAVVDSDTTRKSHLYIQSNASTTLHGLKTWVPGSGAFDARIKITSVGIDDAIENLNIGLLISDDTTPTNGALILLDIFSSAFRIRSFTLSGGSFTLRGSPWTYGMSYGGIYFRITRDGSNNLTFLFGGDGYGWITQAVQAHTFTVGNIGVRIEGSTAVVKHYYIDWLRTDV